MVGDGSSGSDSIKRKKEKLLPFTMFSRFFWYEGDKNEIKEFKLQF